MLRTCMYRLWPSLRAFQPAILQAAAEATVACLVEDKQKVLWVPGQRGQRGAWVSADQACLLPAATAEVPSSCVINAGRRAGLYITNAPEHIIQARTCLLQGLVVNPPDLLKLHCCSLSVAAC